MFSTILTLAASFLGIWAFCKYVVFIEMRVDGNTFKTLYDYFKDENKFVLYEEFTSEAQYPVFYSVFCLPKSVPFFFLTRNERLFQAGWQSKDYLTVITCLRWDYNRFKNFLNVGLKDASFKISGVPIRLLLPFGTDKIGSLKIRMNEPMIDPVLWRDFDNEVGEMLAGKRIKTSALLHGLPGTGKTSLVKYLSTKYDLPIMIFTLNPEWNNHDLLFMFSNIPSKCIVLMEDFDNYFDKRQCTMGNDRNYIKFTFDIILNGLDGVYNTYDKVVFIMTVNDIDKVDDALKNRPSRFKFVKHFDNPSFEARDRILGKDWADLTAGMNLDQIYRIKEYQDQGLTFKEAMLKLGKNIDCTQINRIAENIYRRRLAFNLPGNDREDWFAAENIITSK